MARKWIGKWIGNGLKSGKLQVISNLSFTFYLQNTKHMKGSG